MVLRFLLVFRCTHFRSIPTDVRGRELASLFNSSDFEIRTTTRRVTRTAFGGARVNQLLPSCKRLCHLRRPKPNSSRPCYCYAPRVSLKPRLALRTEARRLVCAGDKKRGRVQLRSRNDKDFNPGYHDSSPRPRF